MKQNLAPLNLYKLEYSQLGELVKQHLMDLANPINGISVADGSPLKNFVTLLESELTPFEIYIENARTSEHSAPLSKADLDRENDLRAINRYMRLLEMSNDEEEKETHRILNIVWQVHKGLVNEVDANQTIGIENMAMDFEAEKVLPYTQKSGILPYINRARLSNQAYRQILEMRNAESAERTLKEGLVLRANLLNAYRNYANYVFVMANLYPDDAQWGKILSLLNVTRKKFSELLARRK